MITLSMNILLLGIVISILIMLVGLSVLAIVAYYYNLKKIINKEK